MGGTLAHQKESVEEVWTSDRMPSGCLPCEVVQACLTGRRPRGRRRTRWRDYVSQLAHVPLEEFEEVRQQSGQGLPCSTNPENKLMNNCAVTFMHKEAPCLIWSGPLSCSFSSIFIKKRDDTNRHSHVLGAHTHP